MRTQGRDEFDQALSVKMVLHAQSSGTQQQLLAFELTDEANPHFLFTMDCSESDFHLIKTQQQFHFDFQTFPHYIAEQLEKAKACCATDQPGPPFRSFLCQFVEGVSNEGQLNFVEQNQYQSIVRLFLALKKGNDERVKKFLGGKVKELKEALG